MPHRQLPGYPIPKSEEEEDPTIWRYMSLAKFVSILDTQALYFSRASNFPDDFEGLLTESTIEHLRDILEGKSTKWGADAFDNTLRMFKAQRQQTYVNCWHSNPHESMAMWNQYSKHPLALKSTHFRLSDSLGGVLSEKRTCDLPELKDGGHSVYISISPVKYVDFVTDSGFKMDYQHIDYSFLYKRKPYQYENEVRAIIPGKTSKRYNKHQLAEQGVTPPYIDSVEDMLQRDTKGRDILLTEDMIRQLGLSVEDGLYIGVDLNKLIKAVVVEPEAPNYLINVVKSLMRKYEQSPTKVERSSLEATPTTE